VARAEAYRWSSAAAHLSGIDEFGILDLDWWQEQSRGAEWTQALCADEADSANSLRRCTYAGQPFGSEDFVEDLSRRFGRYWKRGRPRAEPAVAAVRGGNDEQLSLFTE
jgi:putative transposase